MIPSRKIYLFLLLAFLVYEPLPAQETDYRKIFSKDWEKAETFIRENEGWMRKLSARYNVSFPVAAAVVFPELVRYSAIRDKIEITLLKTLYINLGEKYADFSVGPFQMKPSFAEIIRAKAPGLRDKIRSRFSNGKDADPRAFRKSILDDLEDPQSQFVYLIAFIKICDSSFSLRDTGEMYRLKILATAYNCGPDRTLDQVMAMSDRKFFNTKLYSTQNYSYSEVSLFWYKSYLENRK